MESLDEINLKSSELIVYNLKYALEHSNHSEFLEKIDEQKKKKDDEIEKICRENSKIFLEYFKKFLLNRTLLSNFTLKVSNFSDKVYKISLRNKYDTKEISSKKEAIINTNKSIELVNQIIEVINQLIKSIDNLNKDKFMACIRIISQIKKKPIYSQNLNQNLRNLFNDVFPLIILKIRKKSDTYIYQWVQYCKEKQKESGANAILLYEEDFKAGFSGKTIHLFNENNNYIKSSFVARNDNIKKTFYRESLMPNMRKTMNLNRNRNVLFKIDFYLLNQCQQIYENINESHLFIDSLKSQRFKELANICESEQINNVKDMRNYIINIIGFFIIERELMKQFNGFNQLESLWIEGTKKIEKNLGIVFERISNSTEYLEIKNELHLLAYVIQKLGFNNQMIKILMIIKDNFIKYSEKIISHHQTEISQKIYNDDFSFMVCETEEEYKKFCKIFDVQNQINDDYSFKCTDTLPEIIDCIINFINSCISYLKGVLDAEGLIHIQLDRFYFKLYEIHKEIIDKNFLNVIQLCQTLQNLNYLENSMKFFQNAIENNLKILCTRDYDSSFYFQQLKMHGEEAIQEIIKGKIDQFLRTYYEIDWLTKIPNKVPHVFIQDMTDYLLGIIKSMKMINSEMVFTLVYLSFKYINSRMIEVICSEKIKSFNIIGLVNLEVDLLLLYNICGNHLREYENIMECFREIRQFLDLFLVYHPNDILDSNLRANKYNRLNLKQLIIIFEKYKKIVVGKYPVVRRRHVRAAMEKLKLEIQNMK